MKLRLTYSNIVSTLALFAALTTGTAVASGMIDGRTIKNNSIPASKLMNNSVTSAKIKNGQVVALDVRQGSLTPTVFNSATQQKIASLDGDSSQGGTRCSDGSDLSKCSLVDVVPSGVGLPCRFLEGALPNGVWEQYGTMWLCAIRTSDGATTTSPAKAGQYSGAVNA